jgi:hypothetical protein
MASELTTAPVETADLATEVEELVDFAEPEGIYRDTRECGAKLALLGLLVAAPTPPRPKKDVR